MNVVKFLWEGVAVASKKLFFFQKNWFIIPFWNFRSKQAAWNSQLLIIQQLLLIYQVFSLILWLDHIYAAQARLFQTKLCRSGILFN